MAGVVTQAVSRTGSFRGSPLDVLRWGGTVLGSVPDIASIDCGGTSTYPEDPAGVGQLWPVYP